jgi:phosphatidylinositol phospholipase C delta
MTSATSSPSALNGEINSSSKLHASSLVRLPKSQNAVSAAPTGTNPSPFSSIPSTATTSVNIPTANSSPTTGPRNSFSNASSPAGTPFILAADSARGRYLPYALSSPVPLELDETADNMAIAASLPSEQAFSSYKGSTAPTTTTSGPGLMRRISRGAANKLTRRRQSSTQRDTRDHSSGPVIMRRRSDGKAHPRNGRESIMDSSFDDEETEVYEPLGAWGGSEPTNINGELTPAPSEVGAVAPKVDSALQRGTLLTKVTKKKSKQVRFFLDLDAAKVRWDLTNPAKRFYIDDIKEIRVGPDARNYREEYQIGAEAENRWITIVFADPDRSKGRPVKTMHLITPDDYTLELWTATLEHISRYRIGLMAGLAGPAQSDTVLRAHWQRGISRLFPAGSSQPAETESLDLAGIESVCQSLHINCSKKALHTQFVKADVDCSGKLNYSQFKRFISGLKERKDIRRIYKDLAVEKPEEGLSLEEFLDFLEHVQKEDVAHERDYWVSHFDRVVRRSRSRTPSLNEQSEYHLPRMSLDALSSFLLSEANGIYASHAPESRFDRPLNEYFISSSHNTYLVGRQVAGASSTEAYISALQQGCRCLEIDCWDGSDGRPIVSHGRTWTTSVLFADCITVINRYAFISTDFPLILSLEVHCNPEQQLAMVKIMKDTFLEQLILEPLLKNCAILPSPEELKNRILIKVKTCDEPQQVFPSETTFSTPSFHGRKRSSSTPFLRSTGYESGSIGEISLSSPPTIGPSSDTAMPMPFITPGRRSGTTTSMSSATEDSDSALMTSSKASRKQPKRSKITKPLSDLGVYTRGFKWRSFGAPESKSYNHVFSFAEKGYESATRDVENKALFETHNKRFLTRVYPAPTRIRSTNFDPTSFWRSGVQMVALNWQTYDIGMQMNQAMFAAGTDRTGYILKPESMRRPSSTLESIGSKKPATTERVLVRLSVNMISAQQLPRPRGMGPDESINPYVEIEMYTADDRGQCIAFGEGGQNVLSRNATSLGLAHRRRTKTEASNGFSPVFNDQFRLAVETKYPDLVFVRWRVLNSPDGRSAGGSNPVELATFTAKLTSLSEGYRYLPLYDTSGDQYLFSTLFCKITKENPVPVQRLDLDELKAERTGIFRQIGQTVFKRALSTERSHDRPKAERFEVESVRSKDSPSLAPVLSTSPTIPPLRMF